MKRIYKINDFFKNKIFKEKKRFEFLNFHFRRKRVSLSENVSL